MARHISSVQVLDHIKTATSISVDGTIYKNILIDADNLNVGPIKFPITLFDIGGMNRDTIVLMDSDNNYRSLMLLGSNGYKIDHPEWEHEEYLPEKIRNHHLLNK